MFHSLRLNTHEKPSHLLQGGLIPKRVPSLDESILLKLSYDYHSLGMSHKCFTIDRKLDFGKYNNLL